LWIKQKSTLFAPFYPVSRTNSSTVRTSTPNMRCATLACVPHHFCRSADTNTTTSKFVLQPPIHALDHHTLFEALLLGRGELARFLKGTDDRATWTHALGRIYDRHMSQAVAVIDDGVGVVSRVHACVRKRITSYSEVTRCAVMVARGMATCESCTEALVSTALIGICPSATSRWSLYPRQCWGCPFAAGFDADAFTHASVSHWRGSSSSICGKVMLRCRCRRVFSFLRSWLLRGEPERIFLFFLACLALRFSSRAFFCSCLALRLAALSLKRSRTSMRLRTQAWRWNRARCAPPGDPSECLG